MSNIAIAVRSGLSQVTSSISVELEEESCAHFFERLLLSLDDDHEQILSMHQDIEGDAPDLSDSQDITMASIDTLVFEVPAGQEDMGKLHQLIDKISEVSETAPGLGLGI